MADEPEVYEAEPINEPESEAIDLSSELDQAIGSIKESTAAFVFDGDRDEGSHQSGAPTQRGFTRGDDDPRDADLHERVEREDVAWTGRIFNVNRIEAKLPNGHDAMRDVVRHPGAVAIVALTDDGRICLVRQYRTAIDRVTVEIPAGKLDPGEDPYDCAVRELREETGAVADRMAFLTTIVTAVGFCDEVIHLYMATGLHFEQSDPDSDEFINVDLVELPELIDAVLDGKVEDAKTVVGALLCDAISRRLGAMEQ
jgi:ADP-ribose pyrophosphatase